MCLFLQQQHSGGMSLTSILGYQKVNSFEDRDFDQLDLNALYQEHAADTETTSIELRLALILQMILHGLQEFMP